MNKLNYKIKDNLSLDGITLQHTIEDITDKKYSLFKNAFKEQCISFKNICINELEIQSNKCTLLYLFFLTVELYTKYICIEKLKLLNYKHESNVCYGDDNKKISVKLIGHNLMIMKEILEYHKRNQSFELNSLRELYDLIFKMDIKPEILNNYTNLRYNSNKESDCIYIDTLINEQETEKIKEILTYVKI